MSLYNVLQRLIGQNWLTYSGLVTLRIWLTKVWLVSLSMWPPFRKFISACPKSSPWYPDSFEAILVGPHLDLEISKASYWTLLLYWNFKIFYFWGWYQEVTNLCFHNLWHIFYPLGDVASIIHLSILISKQFRGISHEFDFDILRFLDQIPLPIFQSTSIVSPLLNVHAL